jgi:hypothetical protein
MHIAGRQHENERIAEAIFDKGVLKKAEATASSSLCRREGTSKFRHPADPAVVIVGLFPHITKDLRMR